MIVFLSPKSNKENLIMINSDATKLVLKRLSSLRAVLESDEQRVLDSMVTGAYSVEAHQLSPEARSYDAEGGEDEVLAHQLSPEARSYDAEGGEDEVLAHQLSPEARSYDAEGGEDEVLAHVLSFKVAFDGDQEAYVIIN
jgi:hypothetical protein